MPNLRNAQLNADRRLVGKKKAASTQETLASSDEDVSTEQTQQEQESGQEQGHQLLKINVVTTVEALKPLPHIGEGRARTLLKNRGDGYTDLADLKARSGVSLTDSQWHELALLLDFGLPIQE